MTNSRNSRRKSQRRVSLTFHYRAEMEKVEMTREYSRHWVSAQKLRTTASWTWAAWPACALCGNDEQIIWENAKSARKPPVTAHPSDRPALPGQRAGAGVSAKTHSSFRGNGHFTFVRLKTNARALLNGYGFEKSSWTSFSALIESPIQQRLRNKRRIIDHFVSKKNIEMDTIK